MSGKISVIIPVYNMENTVGKSIDSVLGQTWTDLELVLVDDGSTDASGRICDEAAARDTRVKVIHKANGGVSSARNAGLKAATGDFIAWLDSDDWMEPKALAALMNAIDASGATMAICNYENVERSGKRKERYTVTSNELLTGREALERLIKREITQSLWANLVPRRMYDQVSFPEGKVFEDVCTTYKFYENSETVAVVNDTLLFNRLVRQESISHIQSVENRIASCESYLARQQDLQTRWPESEAIFVRYNYGMLLLSLRSAVFRDTPENFHKNCSRVKAVAAYFRKRRKLALGEKAPLPKTLEYLCLTSGTRAGFYLSRIVSMPKKGGTWLDR